MRGQISDQDLTDYALNEMPARERLYVESLLAVSPECRNDVYEMIEVALMLEDGLMGEGEQETVTLRPEQRAALLAEKVPARRGYFAHVTLALAAAAVVAVAALPPEVELMPASAAEVARVSGQVSSYVVEAVTPEEGVDFSGLLADAGKWADDPVLTKWFSSDWFSGDGGAQGMAYAPAAGPGWDSLAYGSLESAPY